MSFIETRFPTKIAYGAKGGPMFSTTIVQVNSGAEYRNQNWVYPLHKYDVGHVNKNATEFAEVLNVFWAVGGRASGFRFKDHKDYQTTDSNGILGTGFGNGTPTYQAYKTYSFGGNTVNRKISKPVASTQTIKRGGSAVTAGSAAGNYSIDTTTGIVTFVSDADSNASSITPGATTQVVLASNLGLGIGKQLYLTGFTGADAALVNNLAHVISNVTGTGPYTFTLTTNTSGKTITLGSGAGHKYPQGNESLSIATDFDVPVRFDTDLMQFELADLNAYTWQQILLVELRL